MLANFNRYDLILAARKSKKFRELDDKVRVMAYELGKKNPDINPKEYHELKEALEKTVIIHFANPEKPWQNKKLPLSDIWWSYAYATPYFHKKRNIKPYLLFPYYLIAMVFMKYIKIPVLKFVKHTKQIWYSHSHRGKMDMLNKNFTKTIQSVMSVKNDINNQITQIKNQQRNLEKQIADLKNTVTKTRNAAKNIADVGNQ